MFDPILAPDVHRGPATGHTSEHGTTWQDAAGRINAAFKALFERAEAPVAGISREFVAALEARFEQAEDKIADLGAKVEFQASSLEATIKALVAPAQTPAPSGDPDGGPTDETPAT